MKKYKEPSFILYINNISKYINPDMNLSFNVKNYLQKLIISFIDHFTIYASTMMEQKGIKTLTSKEINNGIQLFLVGELRKHAISEATKALTKFNNFVSKKGVKVGNAEKAGIKFPPCRVRYVLENRLTDYRFDFRISETAPVYLASVIDYLISEILELTGVHIENLQRKTIQIEDVKNVINNDDELTRSLCRLNLS
jgi:histone H2B